MKILFAGGGTAGHVIPIIAVARELRSLYPRKDLELFYMGPKDELAHMLLFQEGVSTLHIKAGKIRRYGGIRPIFQNIADIFIKMPLGILQAFWKIYFLNPDLVFSKGGYGALPAVLAAWMLRAPIFLHESDAIPGMANRFCAMLALEIFTSFPRTNRFPLAKIIVSGNPVRKQMLNGSWQEAARLFELQGGKPLVFILGGSQGAQRVNDMLLAILPEAIKHFEIIHQTGERNIEQVKKEAGVMIGENNPDALYYHAVGFLKETELKHAYAAADFVVARGGSGTIFEIAAFGKPSIVIPLPESAQNHQLENAYAYAKSGAAVVLEESNIAPHFFLERLKYLSSSTEEREKMKEAAMRFAKPEAAKIIATYIIEFLSQKNDHQNRKN